MTYKKLPTIDYKKLKSFKVRISQIPPFDVAFKEMALTDYEVLVATIYRLNELIEINQEFIDFNTDIWEWVVNDGLSLAVLERLTLWLNDGTLETLINETLFNMKLDKTEFEDYKTVVNQALLDLEQNIQSILDGEINRIDGELEDLDKDVQEVTTQLAQIAVNVRNFGALGDGSTDDTESIQNALNTGENVYFPAGVYIVNGSSAMLTVLGNQHLFGDGQNSVIKVGSNNQYVTVLKLDSPNKSLKISNLTFDGNGAENPMNPDMAHNRFLPLPSNPFICVQVYGKDLIVNNVKFIDFYGTNVIEFEQNHLNDGDSFVSITDNLFLDIGEEYGNSIHDHSTVYVHKTHKKPMTQVLTAIVDGNVFKAKYVGAPNAFCTFELGGDVSTARRNSVDGYWIGGLSAPRTNESIVKVLDNIFNNVMRGFIPWASTLSRMNDWHTNIIPFDDDEGKVYRDLVIDGNLFNLSPALFSTKINYEEHVANVNGRFEHYCTGVIFQSVARDMGNVTISNNSFDFGDNFAYDISQYNNATIQMTASPSTTRRISVESINITDNRFKNTPQSAIFVNLNKKIGTFEIEQNDFMNTCIKVDETWETGTRKHMRRTINVVCGGDGIDRLKINNNDIQDGNFVAPLLVGQSATMHIIDNLELLGNNISLGGFTTRLIESLAKYDDVVINSDVMSVLNQKMAEDIRAIVSNSENTGIEVRFYNGEKIVNQNVVLYRESYENNLGGYTHFKGDLVYNTNPAVNGWIGWINLNTGNVFSGFGMIDS